MKIQATNLHNNYKNIYQRNSLQPLSMPFADRLISPLLSQKYSPQKDIVSFGTTKSKPVKDLRQIPDITCACCGVETIKNSEIDSFMAKRIYYPASEAIKVIEASGVFNKKKLTKSQETAYEFCKLLGVYEGETLSKVLDKVAVNEKFRTFPKEVRENIKMIESMTRRVFHNSKYMVKELEQFEPRMNKTEKEIFQLIKHYSQKYPNKSFTEIFNEPEVYETNLQKLEHAQGEILFDIDKIAEKMSTPSRKKLHNLVKKSYNIFINENPSIKNKRSRIINMFEQIEDKIPEKELMEEVINTIYKLPSSRNNVSSFIVKYRDSNPNEIADLILRGSSSTIEHVKPHKRPNDPGENDIKNYLVLCKNCNQERQQIPYNEFIKKHPDMPKNTQKYLDKVIEYINKGLLIGFNQYPIHIKKTVADESDGKILLDYSQLDLLEAAQNIKKYDKKRK